MTSPTANFQRKSCLVVGSETKLAVAVSAAISGAGASRCDDPSAWFCNTGSGPAEPSEGELSGACGCDWATVTGAGFQEHATIWHAVTRTTAIAERPKCGSICLSRLL